MERGLSLISHVLGVSLPSNITVVELEEGIVAEEGESTSPVRFVRCSAMRLGLRCGSNVLTIDICCAWGSAGDNGTSTRSVGIELVCKPAGSVVLVAFSEHGQYTRIDVHATIYHNTLRYGDWL
jgi:hypothetical protein